jgi:outer membrane receptor for ferrienterochelin and colicins
VNAFSYWIHNPIVVEQSKLSPSLAVFDNGKEQTGYGVESAITWDVSPSLQLKANYSFQESLDRTVNSLGTGPRHQVFSEIVWRPLPSVIFGVNTKSVLGRDRSIDDPRPPVADYTVVNMTLQLRGLFDRADVMLTARNLFNEDARDPSVGFVALPYDYPLPGRNFWVELRLRLG